MKAHIIIISCLAICLLALTSCSEDSGLVKPVNLSAPGDNITETDLNGEYFSAVSANDIFRFSAPITLTIGKGSTTVQPEGSDLKISIRGESTSYQYKWGSWETTIDLIYDLKQNTVSGYYHCIFPDMGDEVLLYLTAENSLIQTGEIGGRPVYSLKLTPHIQSGTGRFAGKTIEGETVLRDALNLLTIGTNGIQASIATEGKLLDEQ